MKSKTPRGRKPTKDNRVEDDYSSTSDYPDYPDKNNPKRAKSKNPRGRKPTKDNSIVEDYPSNSDYPDYHDKNNPKSAKSKTSRGRKPTKDYNDEEDYPSNRPDSSEYPDKETPKRVISETPRGRKPTNKRSIMQAKCKNKRRREGPQLDCDVDFDCYHGQYCATDENLCMDKGCQEFDDECERNGGNFHKIL